jgi:iron complex transport system substrate-binding protein
MRRAVWLVVAFLALSFVGAAVAEPLNVTDDVGRQVTLNVPVKRSVIFNRYTTEFVRAVAGMDVIAGVDAGVVKEATYWPKVTRAMLAGEGQTQPNYEAIVALKPDVVFFPRNSVYEEAIRKLEPFGIPVVVLTAWDVLKHEENVTLLGRIFQQPERAAKLNAFYTHYRDLLAERLKGVTRKRVYMEEVVDYKTLLIGSGWHDMIEAAGGRNVFDDVDIAGQPARRGNVNGFDIDPEEILVRNPEVMVKLQPAQYDAHPAAFSAQVLKKIAARPGFAGTPVIKSGQLYHMSYYLAGGCSKIIGALQLAKWLYPERFADIDPGEAMRAWLEDFQGVPMPKGYWTSLAQLGE